MNLLLIALTLIVSLGILNVWVLRRDQPTAYRGQAARTLREEFTVYGLPAWAFPVIGVTKVLLAAALLLSLQFSFLGKPAAMALGLIMVVAFGMHLKVKDPVIKSLPSVAVLAMCVGIILL